MNRLETQNLWKKNKNNLKTIVKKTYILKSIQTLTNSNQFKEWSGNTKSSNGCWNERITCTCKYPGQALVCVCTENILAGNSLSLRNPSC